jgi:hypothetical protein
VPHAAHVAPRQVTVEESNKSTHALTNPSCRRPKLQRDIVTG